jgi:hypothetical protein
VLVVLALALAVPGCARLQDAAQRAQRTNDLKAIGFAYHNYVKKYDKAPTEPAALDEFLAANYPRSVQALNDGSVVFLYGVKPDELKKPADTVLAYDKNVPEDGGLILMADDQASVKHVTAQEFDKMPQAKPANPK